jgi:hypothetical protein
MQDSPRNGEYMRGSFSFAQCDNGDCSKAGIEVVWALIPHSMMGTQYRHLGGSTHDGRRVLPDQGARNAMRRQAAPPDAGYYGDDLRPEDEGQQRQRGAERGVATDAAIEKGGRRLRRGSL